MSKTFVLIHGSWHGGWSAKVLWRRKSENAQMRVSQQSCVLLPFIKDGLECGEKAVHTADPDRCNDHLRRLAKAGIDVATARESGHSILFVMSNGKISTISG